MLLAPQIAEYVMNADSAPNMFQYAQSIPHIHLALVDQKYHSYWTSIGFMFQLSIFHPNFPNLLVSLSLQLFVNGFVEMQRLV